jgi:hypothetical protein
VTRRGVWSNTGPVPARDLASRQEAEPAGEAGDVSAQLRFEVEGEEWLARPAGAGCYGTGRRGAARLLAVHFYRATGAGEPVREALIPAGAFAGLGPEELVAVWSRATPIETG